MTVAAAQHDLRFAFVGGAPGMFASAAVWLAAGIVALMDSPRTAVLALFAGGMFIHPVGVLIAKACGRPGAHRAGNPLGALALESTGLMLLVLPLAYVVSLHRIEWFFPAMLLVIGGRYLTFATLYGLRVYWACGGTLAVAAWAVAAAGAAPAAGAFTGAAVETVFAVVISALVRGEGRPPGA